MLKNMKREDALQVYYTEMAKTDFDDEDKLILMPPWIVEALSDSEKVVAKKAKRLHRQNLCTRRKRVREKALLREVIDDLLKKATTPEDREEVLLGVENYGVMLLTPEERIERIKAKERIKYLKRIEREEARFYAKKNKIFLPPSAQNVSIHSEGTEVQLELPLNIKEDV